MYLAFLMLSFCFTVFIPTPALAETNERDLNPDKEDIVSSYSFGPYQSDKWSVVAVDTPDINNPGSGVTIAILDSGVTKIENLSCHNFVHEYDSFWGISGPGSALDISGHGTTVALTIADCDDGIANSVNIMPVRVFTDYYASWGFPTYTDDWAIAEGIIWAVNHGADIINISLGSPCYKTWEEGCRGDPTYPGWVDNAIQYASNNGVLVVAASGNSALPWVSFPANHPDVWAVGAVDINLDKSYFSNSGEALTFVGPGENVETALGDVSGTSFSSPEVAAAAAVLKGSMPGLTVEEIEGAFVCTIIDLGDAGWDPEYGWGMPQIEASLDLLQAGLLQTPWWVSSELILTSEGQGVVRATWESADDCNSIESYYIDIEPGGSNTVTYADNATEFLVSDSGVYTVYAKAINEFGNQSELISNTIEIDLTPPSWDNGTEITINLDGDNLVYSWNDASDLSSISRYELLVERDGLFVVQTNTLDTSAEFNSGNFEEPGIYTVIVKAFDAYENSSFIETQFEIVAPEPIATTTTSLPASSSDEGTSTTTTIPIFSSVSTTTTLPEYMTTQSTTTTIPSSTTTTIPSSTTTTVPSSTTTTTTIPPSSITCEYFSNYEDAKTYFDEQVLLGNDVSQLDGDNDGQPCEILEGGPSSYLTTTTTTTTLPPYPTSPPEGSLVVHSVIPETGVTTWSYTPSGNGVMAGSESGKASVRYYINGVRWGGHEMDPSGGTFTQDTNLRPDQLQSGDYTVQVCIYHVHGDSQANTPPLCSSVFNVETPPEQATTTTTTTLPPYPTSPPEGNITIHSIVAETGVTTWSYTPSGNGVMTHGNSNNKASGKFFISGQGWGGFEVNPSGGTFTQDPGFQASQLQSGNYTIQVCIYHVHDNRQISELPLCSSAVSP